MEKVVTHSERMRVPEADEYRAIEAMRSVINRDLLVGTSKIIFNKLFPASEKKQLFPREAGLETRAQNPTSKYNDSEKSVASLAYNALGFLSDKKEKRPEHERSKYDLRDFRISYLNSPNTYINRLNALPIMSDMQGVSMAAIMPNIGSSKEYIKMDREKHSRILGAAVTRDIIRMAVKTPDLFLKLVKRDMHYYHKIDNRIKLDLMKGEKNLIHLKEKIIDFNEKGRKELEQMKLEGKTITQQDSDTRNINVPPETLKALASGIEYAKYVTLFAYLHDSQTPALADTIMKGKKRFPGQVNINFSEDARLKKEIHEIINSKSEDIKRIFNNFGLSKKFFEAQVRSMCEENDDTLGGMLIKNKRKKGYIDKGGWDALQDGYPAFDRDQVAGTIANMEDRANLHLPGGFRHTYKTDHDWDTPIGSFTERLQLMTYAMARNMDKKELEAELRKKLRAQGIKNPKLQETILQGISITAEEFEYGPNFRLRELPNGEIVPVALNPGSLKRLLHSFATLTYFHYQGDHRSAYETLIQDILTSIHAYQKLPEQQKTNPSNDPEMTDILRTFIERSDRGALTVLRDMYPVLLHIITNYLPKGVRITEKELPMYLNLVRKEGKQALVSRANFYSVDQKRGTLVEDELDPNTTPTPYLEIIRRKKRSDKTGRDENPHSLPNRLDEIKKLEGDKLYYVIPLDHTDKLRLKNELKKMKGVYRDITTRALKYWMMDLHVGEEIIQNSLNQEFLLPNEKVGVSYAETRAKKEKSDGIAVSLGLDYDLLALAQSEELYPESKVIA